MKATASLRELISNYLLSEKDDDNDTVDDPIDAVALGMLFVVVPFDDLFFSATAKATAVAFYSNEE